MSVWGIGERDWDDPAGAALRAAQEAELDARYGAAGHEPGTRPSAADIDVFLVATLNGAPVGCGALRRLDDISAEVKRMYVRPDHRRMRIGKLILEALEDAARDHGWAVLRLETGVEQPEARRLYERAGYREIPPFGPYVGSELSVCYERDLTAG